MKKNHGVRFVSLFFLFTFLLVAGPGGAAPAVGKTITLKFCEVGPPTGLKAVWSEWFKTELEKRTEGRVSLKFFFAETLLKNRELLKGIQDGVSDIGMMGAMWFPAQMPLQTAFSIPALGPPADFSKNPENAVKAIWEVWDSTPALHAELKKWNQTLLTLSPWLPYELFSKKEISSIADLKGLRVRELGAKGNIMYKPYGAIPVAISPPEIYGALEKGVIDAVAGSLDWGNRFGLKEVSKYLILAHFNPGSGIVTINLDSLNKLSAADRETLFAVAREYSFGFAKAHFESIDSLLGDYKKAGVTIQEFPKAERDKWRDEAEEKMIAAWLDQVKKTGGSVEDAKEVIGKYLKAVDAMSAK